MPQDLNKTIDEFKSAPNKALMKSYILAIIFLSGVIVKMTFGSNSKNERELQECKTEKNLFKYKLDSMIIHERYEDLADKRELKLMLQKQDSIKASLEQAIHKLIQRR